MQPMEKPFLLQLIAPLYYDMRVGFSVACYVSRPDIDQLHSYSAQNV